MAKAVYMSNLPFNHYESKDIQIYLYGLDLLYKTTSYSILLGYLLGQYYKKIKNKVDIQLHVL